MTPLEEGRLAEMEYVFARAGDAEAPILLLLHGTGGNEHDLIPLARQLLPQAHLLSPRGSVLESGMPRFFRRLAEGVFDIEDLHARTAQLNRFIEDARERHHLDREQLFALGFSNGANIAASLLLSGHTLGGALLLRAMIPFEPAQPFRLRNSPPVRVQSGESDPIVPLENARGLVRHLEAAGAKVEHGTYVGGHALTPQDMADGKAFLERVTE